METFVATHEVDDVDHWFSSAKRQEFFEPHGIKATPLKHTEGSTLVAVLIETPDMETFDKAMETPQAGEAMQHDGVRPETLKIFRSE